jgi:hypothetical protein
MIGMIGIVVRYPGMIGAGIDVCVGMIKGLLFWMAGVKLIRYGRYC